MIFQSLHQAKVLYFIYLCSIKENLIMKFKSIFLLILATVVISSCNKQKVYFVQTYTFENGIWPRFEHVKFEVPANPSYNYDLVLEVNYDPNINYNMLPLHIISTTDDGEERIKEFQLRLKDAYEFRGEMQNNGSIAYSHTIRSNFSVKEPTKYKIDIECFYPKYEIPFINSLTLRLVKAESSSNVKKN